MTPPKEKAKELVDKYYHLFSVELENTIADYEAKQCALIAVDELIYETQFEVPNIRQRYWQQVKQEINGI
jgi:hypothetical protein